VPHLRIEEVQELSRQAEKTARAGKGERDSLLIQTLFDGCFRVSEALRLTPESLVQTPYGWVARIIGKGRKVAEVAISSSLASKLLAYAYNKGIKRRGLSGRSASFRSPLPASGRLWIGHLRQQALENQTM
jgi:site-specific recombinase XerD